MPRMAHSRTLWLLIVGVLFAPLAWAQDVRVPFSDRQRLWSVADDALDELASGDGPLLMRDVSFQPEQTTVPVPPPVQTAHPPTTSRFGTSTEFSHDVSRPGSQPNRIDQNRKGSQPNGLTYRVPPSDAQSRAATDAGNHLGKSPAAPSVWIQQRNPIVSDSRISGLRMWVRCPCPSLMISAITPPSRCLPRSGPSGGAPHPRRQRSVWPLPILRGRRTHAAPRATADECRVPRGSAETPLPHRASLRSLVVARRPRFIHLQRRA